MKTRAALRDVFFNPFHIFLIAVTGVWFLVVLGIVIKRLNTSYGMDEDILMMEYGVFSTTRVNIDLSTVRSVEVKQGFIEGWLNVGHLYVKTSGDEFWFSKVKGPNAFATLIRKATKEARKNAGATIAV